jgi:hypothetical protein
VPNKSANPVPELSESIFTGELDERENRPKQKGCGQPTAAPVSRNIFQPLYRRMPQVSSIQPVSSTKARQAPHHTHGQPYTVEVRKQKQHLFFLTAREMTGGLVA